MNEGRPGQAITLFWGQFGARFARSWWRGRWAELGVPSRFGRGNARRKLLKMGRLELPGREPQVAAFGQAHHWLKWETLWVI
jgi:hypothetical protein